MSDHLGNQTSEEIRPAIMRINQLADEGQRLLSTLGSPQLSTGGESFGPSSSSGLGGNTNPTSTSSASSRPPPRTSSITDSLRRLFPSFRNSEHQRSSGQRQSTLPYPTNQSGRPQRSRFSNSGRGRGARRTANTIVYKTVVVVPDPEETAVPTHQKRADLRMQGLVIDEFPFDKRWNEDEVKLNIIKQLPLTYAIRDICFRKASYNTLTSIILPNGVNLSCERLLRIAGQGAVYAQKVPDLSLNDLPTPSSADREINELTLEEGPEHNLSTLSVFDLQAPGPNTADPAEEIYRALKTMFTDKSSGFLRECALNSRDVDEAVDKVLKHSTCSLEGTLAELKSKVDSNQSILITIRRQNIWKDSLTFYKMAMAEKNNLFRQLKIDFKEEEGVDCGALRVEFFQKCLAEGKKILFEDADGFKIPKKSTASLLWFKIFGMVIGHSIVQDGPGVHCFPEWCYTYISTGEFQSCAELLYSEKQIPLNAATALLHKFIADLREADTEKKIEDLLDDNVPLGPVNQQIINGSSWDITKTITGENRALLLSELLIDELLRKRVSQLNAICDGLQVLGVLEFVRRHPKLMKKYFIPGEQISSELLMAELITKDVQFTTEQQEAYNWFVRYVESASKDKLTQLLQFITCFTSFPPTGLQKKIQVDFHVNREKIYPEAATCFHQLFLPICHKDFDDFAAHMDGVSGDGSDDFGKM